MQEIRLKLAPPAHAHNHKRGPIYYAKREWSQQPEPPRNHSATAAAATAAAAAAVPPPSFLPPPSLSPPPKVVVFPEGKDGHHLENENYFEVAIRLELLFRRI